MDAASLRQRRQQQTKTIRAKMIEKTNGKRGERRKWQVAATLAIVLASLFFYLRPSADPLDFASLTEEERQELRNAEPSIMSNLSAGSPHLLGRFCDSGNYCFIVEQRYWWRNGFHAQRIIQYELNPNMALTMARLKMPEIVTAHHLAHERWTVDHRQLTFSYNLVQIAAGFMLEGLSFNRSESSQRVLQIGMGGGTATGYLSTMPIDLHLDVVEIEPNVYAAAKQWFDFPAGPNINVHIMDGVAFVKDAAEKGLTYSSLLLDASSNSPNASIVCPHEVFLQEDVMAAMSKVVGSDGVFSVNLFMPDEQERLQEEVTRQFAAHFRSCSAITILGNGQKFLVCSNRDSFDWTTQRGRMLANLATFDRVMGTQVGPYLDTLNPPVQ